MEDIVTINGKTKTQMILSIHNDSLETFLKTENNEPLAGQDLLFKVFKDGSILLDSFNQKTNENGECSMSLDREIDLNIEISFNGTAEYEEIKNTIIIEKDDEIDAIAIPNIVDEELKRKDEELKKEEKELKRKKKERQKIARQKALKKYEQDQAYYLSHEDELLEIELKNVSLSFKVGNDKIDNLKEYVIRTINRTKEKKTLFKATDDVSFKIFKGEKVGIIGFNGAGKSTLLKIISGVYTPDEGEVIINGNIAPLLSLGAGFDINFSGRENIFLNGAILGYNEEFLKSKYDEILEFSELGEFIHLPVKNYSSGMLSKLGFSIATIVEPDILILDEVLGVGDINFRKKSKKKIKSLMASNTTVLLVSHSIKEIRNICDKAIWIDQGHVVEIGEVNAVCDNYQKAAKHASKEKTKKLKPQRF